MPLDSFLAGFAFAAGAATFFSPCSVGLFPAYVGYYLASGPDHRSPAEVSHDRGAPMASLPVWDRLTDGLRLGGLAASGFFVLFLGIGSLVSLVGTQFIGPYLRWISIGIGVVILSLGLLTALGKFPTFHPKLLSPIARTSRSVFLFGIGYGLASLGCTLPIFLTTILASLTTGGVGGAFLVLLAYGAGMGLVMIAVTAALSVSEGAARAYVRKIVPHIQHASAGLMGLAGGVVIYFYAVVWR